MYRSGSANRFSDDHYSYYTSSPSSKVPTALRSLSQQGTDELPIYEPLSEAAKKDRTRAKFSENAVHLIPLILLLCAFILWFSSNPDIDVRSSSIAAADIEGISREGHLDTGHLPMDLGDMDPAKPKRRDANTIFSQNRSQYDI
ncbi:hypothetical protein PHJA_002248400 [Phtheirospermum japonicum]|uniref:Transmembrane protein n=1 Tax=Phtheirospermum japonicum TaxID=374723 RepID=A0A830CY31_9LAMI|nr:hypothetical protein PHJA_002248400 [Phtheirospermum japonicum]